MGRGRRFQLLRGLERTSTQRRAALDRPAGSIFTYIDDVPHSDWFAALVAFELPITRKDASVIPAGAQVRCGWGITDTKFSIPLDDDAEISHASWCENIPPHSIEHCPHKDAMPHPAQCPYCGGRHVNAAIFDIQLRDAQLNDDGTMTVSDDGDSYADWKERDMLFCHSCGSTYIIPNDVKIEYQPLTVEIPVTAPRSGTPGYIGAGVKWTPEVVIPPESRIDFVDFGPDPMEYYA